MLDSDVGLRVTAEAEGNRAGNHTDTRLNNFPPGKA